MSNPTPALLHEAEVSRHFTYPPGFCEMSADEREAICNGAGPKGFGKLVPDTMYFVSISEAADVHDYMYHVGVTQGDKIEADLTFLRNCTVTILATTNNWILARLRMARAVLYFLAVWFGGEKSFKRKG